MSDIDLIRQLRPDEPLATPDDLRPARGRLAAAITAESGGAPGRPAVRPPQAAHGSRPALGQRTALGRRFTVAAAVAAGVAAALVLTAAPAPVPRPSAGPAPRPTGSAPGAPTPVPGHGGGSAPAVAGLTAAQFLDRAAAAAGRRRAVVPRPDQFVYSETRTASGARDRDWLSVTGARPGLIKNHGQAWARVSPCTVPRAEAGRCYPEAGYLPGLPTDPRAVRSYLVRLGIATPAGTNPKQIPGWWANDAGKQVASLLQTTYLLPAQRAALLEFMARTHGFRLVPRAVDAIGRRGVGIAWRYYGQTSMIIFDPRTYAFLGVRGGGLNVALVKIAIVSSEPALPAGWAGKRPIRAGKRDISCEQAKRMHLKRQCPA